MIASSKVQDLLSHDIVSSQISPAKGIYAEKGGLHVFTYDQERRQKFGTFSYDFRGHTSRWRLSYMDFDRIKPTALGNPGFNPINLVFLDIIGDHKKRIS